MGREFREIINGPQNESVTTSVNAWEESNLRIRQEIEALKEKDTEEKTLELIDKYIALQDSYQNKVLRVITMKKLDIETEDTIGTRRGYKAESRKNASSF